MKHVNSLEKPSSLWGNRNFLLLWSGQTLSLTGDYFFSATITIWMIDHLARGASWLPLATAGVGIVLAFPALLLAPLAGVFVDRWDRRQTMLWTDVIRTLLVAFYLCFSLMVHASFWLLGGSLLILLLCACGSQFFDPARTAIITDLVTEKQYPQAFGSYQQIRYLAQILGPSLALPLYTAFGPAWAFAFNVASYLASFLFILVVRVPAYTSSKREGKQSFWGELIEGGRFFSTNRVLVTLMITGVIFMFAGMAYNAFEYLYGVENLHIPDAWLGLYVGCYGIGVVAGMPLTTMLVKRVAQVELLWICLIGNGLATIVLARVTTMIPGMICGIIIGFSSTSIAVTVRPLTVSVTPRTLIGRIMALETMLVTIASLLGSLIASILASTVLNHFHVAFSGFSFGKLDTIFLGIGLLIIGSGLFARLTLYREVKRLRSIGTIQDSSDVKAHQRIGLENPS